MQKVLLLLICTLTLVACKREEKAMKTATGPTSNSVADQLEKGRIVIALDGMDYHSPIKCSYFNEDYFYFKSDELETTDTNGDGIVINGHQQGDKMILTLMMNGETFTAADMGLQKRETIALGGGNLFSQDGTKSFKATYKVQCK